MRKRIGSSPAARAPFEADATLPHPMLEPPRMIPNGQPETAAPTVMETMT
ncbi:hypothetical protein LWE61_18830 [Sphingobium sufflavum]|nr:hypothetical protein [Sphingobium sufflavum]MCE7798590.1 hypothetical protein [Sphingobium sufflavum]